MNHPRYIQFEPRATKAALYAPQSGAPESGGAAHVAFLVAHRTLNYMGHVSTAELSRRGFTVLGLAGRFENNEAGEPWDNIALDIGQAVAFLRNQPDIRKIVLIGHSGGGPTTSFYQAVAENGPGFGQGPGKLTACSNDLAGLPRADGLILLDAHPGNGVQILRGLNPAVTDEDQLYWLDPALDPFSPANGFNPGGESTYSDAFQEKYFRAQAARMNRLVDAALRLRDAMGAGNHQPSDDDAFLVRRWRARLSDLSGAIDAETSRPHKLIRNDGCVDSSAVVRTVRAPHPDNARIDSSFAGTLRLTVRSFLGTNSIRARHAMTDVDWGSSNSSTPSAVRSIAAPLLVMAMQGHYFIRDAEAIYDGAASADKDFATVEGASHDLGPCANCAKLTGAAYDNARRNLFDYIARWAHDRF